MQQLETPRVLWNLAWSHDRGAAFKKTCRWTENPAPAPKGRRWEMDARRISGGSPLAAGARAVPAKRKACPSPHGRLAGQRLNPLQKIPLCRGPGGSSPRPPEALPHPTSVG